jgi:hypothetical protein
VPGRCVVGDQVDQDMQATPVRLGDDRAKGGRVTEPRVDLAVAGDAVTVIGQRRAVERGQPDEADPQPREVVKPPADPGQIAEPVAVAAGKRWDIDLRAGGPLPPPACEDQRRPDTHPFPVTCGQCATSPAQAQARHAGVCRTPARRGPALGAGLSHHAVLECQDLHARTIWQRPSGTADDRRPRRRRNALAVGPGSGRRVVSRQGPGP